MSNPLNRDDELVADGMLSIAAACAFLQTSRSLLYQLMDDGKLEYAKIGRCRRIPKRGLIKLAKESLVGGSK